MASFDGDGFLRNLKSVRLRTGEILRSCKRAERVVTLHVDHVLYTGRSGGFLIPFNEVAAVRF